MMQTPRTRIAFAAFAAIVLTACATPSALRDAQDAFSRAAEIDNHSRAGMFAVTEAAQPLNRDAGYAAVIERIDGMTSREKGHLESDHLLGNALTLRALSLWRLGRFDDARAAATEITKLDPTQLAARDRALVDALPALIMIDEAYAKTMGAPVGAGNEGLTDVQSLLSKATSELERIKKDQGPRDPVRAYLIQAELAAYVNLLNAFDAFRRGAIPSPEEGIAAQARFCELKALEEGESRRTTAEAASVANALNQWQLLTGVSDCDAGAQPATP